MSGKPAPVEKLMALDKAEFERSLATLAEDTRLDGDGRATIAAGAGHAILRFEALPAETLGGLLALPRARVTIAFAGLGTHEADHFLAEFDRAFQRGGG